MKTLLLAVSALALMGGSAYAQSISFSGGSPAVSVTDTVFFPDSTGLANSAVEDERTRAVNGDDNGATSPTGASEVVANGDDNAGNAGSINVPNNAVANSQATIQIGDGNAAGTVQYGSNNEAGTIQIGDNNDSFILQDGNGNAAGGGANEAAAVQVGASNNQFTLQLNNDNAASTLQEGDFNQAVTYQRSSDNTAATVQYGNQNQSFIGQDTMAGSTGAFGYGGPGITAPGFISAMQSAGSGTGNNAAVAVQTGNANLSSIYQLGSSNGAFALQVQQ